MQAHVVRSLSIIIDRNPKNSNSRRAMGITGGIDQFGSFVSPLVAGYLVFQAPDNSMDRSNVFLFWSFLSLGAWFAVSFRKEAPIDRTRFEVNKSSKSVEMASQAT